MDITYKMRRRQDAMARRISKSIYYHDFFDRHTRKTMREIMIALFPHEAMANIHGKAFSSMTKKRMYKHILGYCILKGLTNTEEPMNYGLYFIVHLCDPVTGKCLKLENEHFMFGGVEQTGGTKTLSLKIKYNYCKIINKAFEGIEGNTDENFIWFLTGKTGAELIPYLKEAISKLGNDVNDNCWIATEGNAKRVLYQILALVQMRPDGVIHFT